MDRFNIFKWVIYGIDYAIYYGVKNIVTSIVYNNQQNSPK